MKEIVCIFLTGLFFVQASLSPVMGEDQDNGPRVRAPLDYKEAGRNVGRALMGGTVDVLKMIVLISALSLLPGAEAPPIKRGSGKKLLTWIFTGQEVPAPSKRGVGNVVDFHNLGQGQEALENSFNNAGISKTFSLSLKRS